MRKFKSIIAILLAAVMLLCFAGCAAKDIPGTAAVKTDNEKAVGTWICKMDISEMMKQQLEAELGSAGFEGLEFPNTKLNVYMAFDFEEDKSCVLYVDEDKTIDSITLYVDDLMDSLIDWMYVMFEDMGISREQADAAFEGQYGMSISEYMDQEMAAALDPEVLADEFADIESVEGYYNFDNGKLYVVDTEAELEDAEVYVEYTLVGDTLTISEGNDDAFAEFEEIGIELPLVFERD